MVRAARGRVVGRGGVEVNARIAADGASARSAADGRGLRLGGQGPAAARHLIALDAHKGGVLDVDAVAVIVVHHIARHHRAASAGSCPRLHELQAGEGVAAQVAVAHGDGIAGLRHHHAKVRALGRQAVQRDVMAADIGVHRRAVRIKAVREGNVGAAGVHQHSRLRLHQGRRLAMHLQARQVQMPGIAHQQALQEAGAAQWVLRPEVDGLAGTALLAVDGHLGRIVTGRKAHHRTGVQPARARQQAQAGWVQGDRAVLGGQRHGVGRQPGHHVPTDGGLRGHSRSATQQSDEQSFVHGFLPDCLNERSQSRTPRRQSAP